MSRRSILATSLLCSAWLAGCTPDAPAPAAAPASPAPTEAVAASASTSAEAPPAASNPVAPLYRQLRDFTVACDNGLRCEAIGMSDDGGFGLVLRLLREPGPAGKQQLRLGSQDAAVSAASFRLDGAAVPALSGLPWQIDEEDELRLDDPAAIARFIDLVGDGTQLTSGEGDAVQLLSLAGMRAALLLVDEHQQRLDTQDAWQRRGERDSAAVPPGPSLPVPVVAPVPTPLADADAARLTRTVRDASAELLQAAECDTPGEGFDIRSLDEAHALDATHALVFTTCWSGAYQASSLVFRVQRDGGDITRIVPPSPPHLEALQDAGEFALLTNAGYIPESATLTHFAKGRGLADCGESAYWVFDGTRFVPGGYAALHRCGGAAPGDWPSLWRSLERGAASR